ncbi:MAG: TolC family protein [Methylotenera sp.]|nr:TolC family protein [Oligoflexia bacterium]
MLVWILWFFQSLSVSEGAMAKPTPSSPGSPASVSVAPGARPDPVLSGPVLSWNGCVEEAQRNNSELRAAHESLRAAEASAKGSYGTYLPQISANLGFTHSNGATVTGGNGVGATVNSAGIVGQPVNNYSATISGSENIFNGLQDLAKVTQAQATLRVSGASLNTTRAKVSYDLKVAYVSLLFSERSVELQNDIAHRREENLRLVELRFQSGRENKGSVLLSLAYLNQAKFEALQARNSIPVSETQLARVLGRDDEAEWIVKDEVPVSVAPPQNPDFKAVAVTTPQHLQSVAQEENAEAGVSLAASGFFPSLSLNGSAGKQDRTWFPQNDRWSVGLNLSLPLFNGGRDYYGTQSAVRSLAAATATRLNVDRVTLTTLKQSYMNFHESIEKVKVDQSFVDAAKLRSEIGRNRYNNGLITFEEWDLIENDLIARQRSLLQSRRDRVIAEAAWEQAQGKGVLQ